MNRRVAVRGIIVRDGKLLCARLKPYRHKDALDYWCTPGGGVDPGEPLVPALQREVFEETGTIPEVGSLLYVQQFIHKDEEQLEFFFHITNARDFLNIDLSKTSHGQHEIEEIGFVDPRKHNVLPKFLSEESFANLTKQPTKIFNYL
jgi:ADP-ribose pyrophosphatase YjhB (NUDIX family)